MSIQALHARIVKLDTEIRREKEVLKKLEREKSLVQRQLNNALDPVARLPLEISSEIFLRSLAPAPPGAHRVPMLLLNICNAWTEIALATPAIWTVIQVNFPCPPGLKEILPIWFERARNRPLSLSFQVKEQFDQDVVTIVWKRAQQLKRLEICELRREDGENLLGNTSPSPGPLPSLETLTLRGDEDVGFSLYHVLEFLRLAPNLLDCFFYNTEFFPDSDLDVGPPLVLPNLRRLIFEGENGTPLVFGTDILQHLLLPRLEALTIDLTDSDLLSFLKRSSPPILELALDCFEMDFAAIAESFCLIPDLRRLELWYIGFQVGKQLFVTLAESPSTLPFLSSLIIHIVGPDAVEITDSFWTALASVLTARRIQFQVFRLTIPDRPPISEMSTPETMALFREQAAGGMQISIGDINETWNIFDD